VARAGESIDDRRADLPSDRISAELTAGFDAAVTVTIGHGLGVSKRARWREPADIRPGAPVTRPRKPVG
jgi:hypothetical protein